MSPGAIYVLTSSHTQLPVLAAPSGDTAGTNGLTPTTQTIGLHLLARGTPEERGK